MVSLLMIMILFHKLTLWHDFLFDEFKIVIKSYAISYFILVMTLVLLGKFLLLMIVIIDLLLLIAVI